MGGQRLAKRSSRAIVGSPTALMAPRTPYRIGAHYWRRGRGLLEIPVQVTPGLRMPFIGTSLGVGGPAVARRLARSLASESTVNLELHGLDALDRFDGLEPLAAVQPDLRVPWSRKLASIGAALWTLKDAGFEFVTLSELAAQFPPAPAADS